MGADVSPDDSLPPRDGLPPKPKLPPIPTSLSDPRPTPDAPWKDAWIRRWIERHRTHGSHDRALGSCYGDRCVLKQYIAPTEPPVHPQMIPFVIFQTWKSTEVGLRQFWAMQTIVKMNPEYEYLLFTDDDCWQFICDNFDASVQRAYELVRPGATKADIWRLLVLLKCGGVYIDSGCFVRGRFASKIGPDSSVVSGMYKDLHQWCVLVGQLCSSVARRLPWSVTL